MIVTIKEIDGPITKILKRKFNECRGEAYISMLKGEDKLFWACEEGLYNNGFKGYLCKWEYFDAIINKMEELGGLMYRGDMAAHGGELLGSDELPLDTIDGFLSYNYYEKELGKK